MPTDNFAIVMDALSVEFRGALRYFDETNNQDLTKLVKRAIRDFSRYRPLIKEKNLTLITTQADYDLPEDYIWMREIQAVGVIQQGFLPEQGLFTEARAFLNYDIGFIQTEGDWELLGRQFVRFINQLSGSVTIRYYGYHDEDGDTLKFRDVDDMIWKAKELCANGIVSALADIGQVNAGPVSFNPRADATAFETKASRFKDEFDRRVSNRPYGSRGIGRNYNFRQIVWTQQGELLF